MNKASYTLRVGLFGIGLDVYWQQFQGLKERLEGYIKHVEDKITSFNIEVVNLGLVDNVEKAFEAGHVFRKQDVDLIFLYATTYALSSTVLQVAQLTKVPFIILNLSPEATIDYAAFNQLNDRTKMTGEWLAYCSACAVPEIANVFMRAGVRFYQVTGLLQDEDDCWQEIKQWAEAAKVKHVMQHNRLGAMGHYYNGMLDIYSDLTQQCIVFGGNIEIIEVDELSFLKKSVTTEQLNDKLKEFKIKFDVQNDCPEEELLRAARTSVALDIIAGKVSAWFVGLLL